MNKTYEAVWSSFLQTALLLLMYFVLSAWLKGSAGNIVEKLDQRISLITGLNVKHPHGEYLQVVNYGIGGHYEPHFDHATVSLLTWVISTVLSYVNHKSSMFSIKPVTVQSCVQAGNWESCGNLHDLCKFDPLMLFNSEEPEVVEQLPAPSSSVLQEKLT